MLDDPTAPLTVKVWTSQEVYSDGDTMKIYVRANKPFFGRLVYADAGGTNYQILPNPYRSTNYFNGGVIYEYPTGEDNFQLNVQGPFGKEKIHLFASTSELGSVESDNLGPVLEIKEKPAEIAKKTRGISISKKSEAKADNSKSSLAEFAEATIEITTQPAS